MAFTYNLIVQEDKPTGVAPGTLWLKKSIGVCQIIYNDDDPNILLPASGQGNLSISDGTYFRTVAESSSPPSSPDEGDIWLQNDNTYWIYLGQWVPFGGG